jgi:hypothetical protein
MATHVPPTLNPYLYRYGPQRKLTGPEMAMTAKPCPCCGGAVLIAESRFSEYVYCDTCDRIFSPADALAKKAVSTTLTRAAAMGLPGKGATATTAHAAAGKKEKLSELGRVLSKAEASDKTKAAQAAYNAAAEKLTKRQQYATTMYSRIAKLAEKLQTMYKQGNLSAGFGLRREVMFSKLWNVATRHGLSEVSAARFAYHLTAEGRASDEERSFYEEVWAAEFSRGISMPEPDLPSLADLSVLAKGEQLHQQMGAVLLALSARVPLWLTSEAGEGKTVLTRQASKLLGLNYVRLQGTLDRTVDDIIGGWGYEPEKGTVWRDGVISAAAQTPTLLHIDEVTALPHEVQFEMHALLEGEPVMQAKNGGHVVKLHPDFRIVANDNSVGQGEAVAYVGTRSTNLAFRDRWAFLPIKPLHSSIRKNVVLDEIDDI